MARASELGGGGVGCPPGAPCRLRACPQLQVQVVGAPSVNVAVKAIAIASKSLTGAAGMQVRPRWRPLRSPWPHGVARPPPSAFPVSQVGCFPEFVRVPAPTPADRGQALPLPCFFFLRFGTGRREFFFRGGVAISWRVPQLGGVHQLFFFFQPATLSQAADPAPLAGYLVIIFWHTPPQ